MKKTIIEDIKRVANLSKLQLSEDELKGFSAKAESVIGYFEKLNELDTSNVGVTSHAIESESILREDNVVKFENTKGILKEVPELDETFIQVPKIITTK